MCSASPNHPGLYLVLKLGSVSRMHRHRGTIHMQLPHDGAGAAQLGLALSVGARHAAQAQQADQDVLQGAADGVGGWGLGACARVLRFEVCAEQGRAGDEWVG